jgi:hypothetical protein
VRAQLILASNPVSVVTLQLNVVLEIAHPIALPKQSAVNMVHPANRTVLSVFAVPNSGE